MPTHLDTVTAMISPALFLTATGSLLLSTANRMGRIIDRIRKLIDAGDQLARNPDGVDFAAERLAHLETELSLLRWRSKRVTAAATILYVAFAAFVGTSLAVALDAFTDHQYLSALPIAFAVAGVGLLLLASVNLVREARTALTSNDFDIRFYHELRDRRGHAGGGEPLPKKSP